MEVYVKMKNVKSVVAFIDLLGAKEIISKDPDGSLETIHNCYEYAKNQIKDIYPSELNIPHINIFSDNIVLSLPLYDKETDSSDKDIMNIISVIAYSAIIQYYFWMNKLLVRGAISFGTFFSDELMVWGQGLVNSYGLESSIAIYPRIIIDPKYGNDMYDIFGKMLLMLVSEDFDGLLFVDPLKRKYIEHRSIVEDLLQDNILRLNNMEIFDPKKYQKYMWMQKYLEENLKKFEMD